MSKFNYPKELSGTYNKTNMKEVLEGVVTDIDNKVKVPSLTQTCSTKGASGTQAIPGVSGWTNVTGASGTLITDGGQLLIFVTCGGFADTAGTVTSWAINIDGTRYPSDTGVPLVYNVANFHNSLAFNCIVSNLASGSHVVAIQAKINTNVLYIDANDYFTCNTIELK